MCDFPYIASVLFTREKFTRVRAYATVEIHLKSAILCRFFMMISPVYN